MVTSNEDSSETLEVRVCECECVCDQEAEPVWKIPICNPCAMNVHAPRPLV